MPGIITLWYESALLQVFLHEDVGDDVEDKFDVGGLSAAGEVGVHRLLAA